MRHASVIVIGAGPAGASCAARLRAAGVDTILLDRAEFPRQKVCAGWLTPRVFDLLQCTPADYPGSLTTFPRLNIRVRGVPFRFGGVQHAIRRVEFDEWLVQRSGVPPAVHDVRSITHQTGRIIVDDAYSADTLVGAGGSTCPVYRTFFRPVDPRPAGGAIVALEEEYPARPLDDRCKLWFFFHGLPGYAWYVPKGGTHVNVGIGGVRESLRRQGRNPRSYWNRFVHHLERRGLVEQRGWRPIGAQYDMRRTDGSSPVVAERDLGDGGRVFLAGDALGLATIDMGEGIGAAIESGQRVADAIIAGRPCDLSGIPLYSILPKALRRR